MQCQNPCKLAFETSHLSVPLLEGLGVHSTACADSLCTVPGSVRRQHRAWPRAGWVVRRQRVPETHAADCSLPPRN